MRPFLKSLFLPGIALCGLVAITTDLACKSGAKCGTSVCVNGGACTNGKCVCPTGYEGSGCENRPRNAYLGNWTVYQTDTIAQQKNYTVNIAPAAAGIDKVIIKNLLNFFNWPINANIVHDSLVIPLQLLQASSIEGKGYRTKNNSIVINYILTDTRTNTPIDSVTTLQ